jgi:hypothetical protein
MNIRQTVLGEIGIRDGLNVSSIDVDGLLRRLLLFDSVVIKSVRLREVPFLVRAFGKDGLRQLLDSGIVKITCEMSGIISPLAKNGVRALPPWTFTFGNAQITGREGILRTELRRLQGVPGLKDEEREVLENLVLAKLVRPPEEHNQQLLSQFESDLRAQTPALEIALRQHLEKDFGGNLPPFEVRVEESEPRVFYIANDLPRIFGISEERAQTFLTGAVNAVAHLNHRIAEMAAYSAITGFADAEAPLLFGKLWGIVKPLNPEVAEKQFARIATIANFPTFVPGKRVDIDRLLAARDSAELREFRDWISTLESLTDDQVREMIAGVRNRLGFMIRSEAGKAVRLVATTAFGFAGPVAGVAAGVFDTFLLERLLPSSGVCAFLSNTYPSLFVSQ